MGYKRIKPSLNLSPYVNYFWILEIGPKDLPFVHKVIPFAWFELFFDLDNNSAEDAKYIGQLSSQLEIIYNKPYRAVGVNLKPSVAGCIFQKPANEFKNCSINWSDLDPHSSFHEQLIDANSENEIISLFENYLTRKFAFQELDSVSDYISELIRRQPTLGISDSIFSLIGLSRRRIEQRFLASIGVSMSTYVRKNRFDNAVDYLCADSSSNLTHIGYDLGYYDQAHFTNEFKKFTGITPKAYRNQLERMSILERSLQ